MHYDVVNNQMFLISALDYLHNLAKNLGAPSESSIKKTSKSGEADGTDQKKKTARGRGTKEKLQIMKATRVTMRTFPQEKMKRQRVKMKKIQSQTSAWI